MTASPTCMAPESMVPGDDAAVVALLGELVDVLDRHPEGKLDRRRLGVEPVERIENGGAVVPRKLGGPIGDVVAAAPGHRDEGRRPDADLVEERGVLAHDLVVHTAVPADEVHLVHHHRELLDAEQRDHVAVPAGVLLHAFRGVDDEQRGLGAGGAGDHVLEELDVARRVEDQVRPQAALEEHAGRVDGDALGLLVLERVEQEGVLERLGVELALRPHLLELPVGKRVGVGEQAADDRALAVIDVTDDHDVHPLGARRSGHARFGRCDGRRHSRVTFLRDRRRAGEPAQITRSQARAGRGPPAPRRPGRSRRRREATV